MGVPGAGCGAAMNEQRRWSPRPSGIRQLGEGYRHHRYANANEVDVVFEEVLIELSNLTDHEGRPMRLPQVRELASLYNQAKKFAADLSHGPTE